MKKGIAISTIVIFIIAIISLGIGLIILATSGMLSVLQGILCVYITTYVALTRGIIVEFLHNLYWQLLGLFALIIFTGKMCRSAPPIGAAICAIMYAIVVTTLYILITGVMGSIPFIECSIPAISRGDLESDIAVPSEIFETEVLTRTAECWNMYTAGKLNPLRGIAPPNPRTCFVINFHLQEGITVSSILSNLVDNTEEECDDLFDSCVEECTLTAIAEGRHEPSASCLMKCEDEKDICYRGSIPTRAVTTYEDMEEKEWLNKNIIKGRIFIKYFDYMGWGKTDIGDNDCFTDEWKGYDQVYWCFDSDVTCVVGGNYINGTAGCLS